MTYEEADAMESPIYHGARFTVEVAGRLVAEHNYSLDRLLENAYDLVPSGAVASVWCVWDDGSRARLEVNDDDWTRTRLRLAGFAGGV